LLFGDDFTVHTRSPLCHHIIIFTVYVHVKDRPRCVVAVVVAPSLS